jgi:ATP-dependent DNA helicase RecQ
MRTADAPLARPDEARDALGRIFGFPAFRPGQEDVIAAVLAGENVLAVMPTGSGKSLLYQLPAVVRPGLTIVVSPLIALMRDQVQHLRGQGIAAAALNSANTEHENRTIEAGVAKGRYRLLYVAPERLVRAETIGLLREANVSLLAIDEAHCVSDWGHDFRPEYLDLAATAKAIGDLQIIAVTATADTATRAEIIERVFAAPPRLFVSSFDRPNIRLAFARKSNPARQIAHLIARHKGESGIVYCASRRGTERLAAALGASGVSALAYHAGLDPDARSRIQDEFLHTEGTVIVATIAFGMGIDKPNVRFVCHADLPQSVEAYYHETGRAGRDGLPADTLTLYGDTDVFLRERRLSEEGMSPFGERERRKLEGMLALCAAPRCRRETLLAAFGEVAPRRCGKCDLCARRLPIFNEAVVAARVAAASLRRVTRQVARQVALHRLAEHATRLAATTIARHRPAFLAAPSKAPAFSPSDWRSILYQLRRAHLIETDPDDAERWAFTEAGLAVRDGAAEPAVGATFTLSSGRSIAIRDALAEIAAAQERLPQAPQRGPDPDPSRVAARPILSVTELRLLAALKAARLELARSRKVAPFGILHDEALIQIARIRPRTEEELLRVPGMDKPTLERHGTALLAVVSRHDAIA